MGNAGMQIGGQSARQQGPDGELVASAAVVDAVKRGDLSQLVEFYKRNNTAGCRRLNLALRGCLDRAEVYRLGRELAASPEAPARANATAFLAWPPKERAEDEEALASLKELADDRSWEVRESAGAALGALLCASFERMLPVVRTWARDPSPSVRRAAIIAVMAAARSERFSNRMADILAVVESLLADRAEYVRRNLGPFAISSCIGPHYPELVLSKLEEWAESPNEQVRWNAAMSFSQSFGKQEPARGLDLLGRMASDPSRYVRTAVVSSATAVARKAPGVALPVLREWARRGPAGRREVARVVLGRLGCPEDDEGSAS